MNDKRIVRIEELKMAASDINRKKDMIMTIYETNIKKNLYKSETYMEELGYDYSELETLFKKLFTDFESGVSELTDLLTKKIIPNYEELVLNIGRTFNKNFADEMTDILELEETNNE